MSTEANKAVARVWFEDVMNHRDVDAIDRAYAEDYVFTRSDGIRVQGREESKAVASALIAAVPDRVSVVEQQIAEGDLVTTRWMSRGTQTGDLVGSPATNGPVTVRGVTISRIRDGQIVEDWEMIQITHG